jgi:pyruvate formate lyase activating enzyme
MDPQRHRRFTGVGLAPILRNLRALDARGADVWIRVPLVPGHNDDDANLEALGRLVSGLRRTRRVHVLPYHRLASAKYERLGLVNPMVEIPSPAAADIDRAVAILASFGLDVHVGG